MKKKSMETLLFAALFSLNIFLASCGIEIDETIDLVEAETEMSAAGSDDTVKSELTVHFIDVGQGDATLITCGEDTMLIDAGDNNQGTKVQNYLKKQDVENLKYVIGTHPDADHIGGLDVILYKFDCTTIMMPEIEKDTAAYRDVIDTMVNKGYVNTLPVVGNTYPLGDAEFTILSPTKDYDDSNNNSIVLLLTHGKNIFLFTGDAEEDAENDMLNSGFILSANVYKAGHHGSRTASNKDFLEAVAPEYAVISCGEDNSYGHPHAETLNQFRAMGIQVFRTDEQGSVTVNSNGTELTWNCSPSETWQAGEGTLSSVTETAPSDITEDSYVCNTNTGKFHYPSCSSVDTIKDSNRLDVTATRDDLINQGYVPCKRCNP